MITSGNLVNLGTIPFGGTFKSDGKICLKIDPSQTSVVGANAANLPFVHLDDGKIDLASPTTQFEQVSYTAIPSA